LQSNAAESSNLGAIPALDKNCFKDKIESSISEYVLYMRCKSGINDSTVIAMLSKLKEVMDDVKLELSMKVMHENQNVYTAINSIVYKVSSVLSQLDTIHKQNEFFLNKYGLIKPVEITLGSRIDQRNLHTSDQSVSKSIPETFQYIPLKKVLQKLFDQTNFGQYLDQSDDDLIRSFSDGKIAKNHELFSSKKNIQIQLYYDDVEVVNPLGAKTKIHELGMFYYSILNLPQKFCSTLPNIFMLAAVYSADLKKYGFDAVLQPFLREISELESSNGMQFETNFCVKGSLTMVIADTLAAHQLLGFQSPSANYFCRLCYTQKQHISKNLREIDCTMRTPSSRRMILDNNNLPSHGIAKPCSLENLNHFSVVENYAFNPIHDLLEGVVGDEIKLIFKHLVFTKKMITVAQINTRLPTFSYGIIESKNKPSSNFTEGMIKNVQDWSIKQKAAQTWCLVRYIPLIFGDLFTEDDPYLALLLLLLEIMEIVFAQELSLGQVVMLDSLIFQHHNLFKQLFSDV